MTFRTLDKIKDLKGKKVLLRVDLNSDFHNGKVIESDRIEAHSETVKFLKSRRARVIILAHQGSPGKKDCVSLKSHARFLNKYVKVKFVSETIGKKAWNEISSMKDGDAILLENVRFLRDEFKPSIKNEIVDFFREVGVDCYVNDAFSISHRDQTSITSLAKVFPHAVGKVMEAELNHIEKLRKKLKNCLFVLGGAKPKDVALLLGKGRVLSSGKLCLIALRAKGVNLGKENKFADKHKEFFSKLRKKEVVKPVDVAIDEKGRREVSLDELPVKTEILDIGKNTIEIYESEIKKLGKNRAIFVKGAPGFFEKRGFEIGTKKILNAVSRSKSFTVVAGGQSSDALNKFKISKKKFSYVSLSGGSLVHYIAGKKLPGVEALRDVK